DTDDLDDCVELAQRYPNVYIEISALGSRAEGYDVVLSRLREAGLTDRTLYGSDGPQGPGFVATYLETTLSVMDAEGYTTDEAAAVLSENFTRLFDLPEVTL
ncbi:MAG: putative TIM-barrel fold metal-dependent hydrolase, partial [Myxococcota bacterium]